MTLTPFPPEALDDLALRILDISSKIRDLSALSRENQLKGFQLHSNKVHEWLGHLEEWVIESTGRMDVELMKLKGKSRGRGLSTPPPSYGAGKRGRPAKK